MKIFTCLAVALLSLSSISGYAIEDSDLKGDLKFKGVTMKGYAQVSTPMAITSEGNVAVTGTVASSSTGVLGSYVALASKDLSSTPIWKIDINSRSIVNAIVADAEGGIFIGGDFQKELVLPGVDGDIKLTGNYDPDDYSGAKHNAFIAHINKEGKVTAAHAIVSTVNPDVLENPGYDKYNAFCNVNSLAYAGGKLYAGLCFQDVITTADGKELKSSTYDMYGGLYSSTSFTIAQVDQATMKVEAYPVVFGGNSSDENYMGLDVKNAKIAVDGSHLYIAAMPTGWSSTASLWIGEKIVDKATYQYQGTLNGFYVADIDLSTNSLVTSKVFDGKYSYSKSKLTSAIESFNVVGDNLYLGGSFIQNFPLDKSIKVTGNTDVFIAVLNKTGLDIKTSLVSGYDETKNQTDPENVMECLSACGSLNGHIIASGYVAKKGSSVSLLTPLSFSQNEASLKVSEDDNYTTGGVISEDGKVAYFAYLTADQTTPNYLYYDATPTAIKTIDATQVNKDAVIYNLQGMKLSAPQKGLNIINGKKVVVK